MTSWIKLQAFAFDKPLKYKDLTIYPVLMENYFKFSIYSECLLINKNTTIEGISKSYLDYLYWLQERNEKDVNLSKFDSLLRLCLRKEDSKIVYARHKKVPYFSIEGKEYTSGDFDELRALICEQNDVDLPDTTISPDVLSEIEEVKRMRAKMNGTILPTLEDMVASVMAATSYSVDDIAKMSIRKFQQLVYRIDAKINYQIYRTASVSGFVKFDDKSVLKHWMAGIEKDNWGDTMISIENLKGKLGDSAQSV